MAFQNTAFQNTAFQIAGAAAVVSLGWFVPFKGPLVNKTTYPTTLVSVTVFPAATPLSSTVTIDGPRVNFRRTLQYQARAFVAVPPEVLAPSNTITGAAYLGPLSRSARKTWPPLAASALEQFAVPGARDGIEWVQPFPLAAASPKPRHTQPVSGYQPVVTVAVPYEQWWQQPLSRAAARPAPRHTQPFFGYPYAAVAAAEYVAASTTTSAARVRTLFYQSTVSAPYAPAAAVNTRTEWDWQVRWENPPRRLLGLAGGSPFVSTPAVAPNVAWLQPLSVPARIRQAQVTQPVSGYQPVVAAAVPYEQWWHQPLSTPVKARPVNRTQPFFGYPYQDILVPVPYEQWWQQPLSRAVPTPNAIPTQPGFVYYQPPNLTTSLEWLLRWQGPPRYQPQSKPYQPFVPKAAVVDQVTPDKWLPTWRGPPRYRPIKVQALPFIPREATIENTITGSPANWLFRFQKGIPGRPVTHTQPFFGYPYADQYVIGGPADEPERVACVPVYSRVAVVPELERTATPLPSDKIAPSNDFENMPCPPFGNEAGIPAAGGVVSPIPPVLGDVVLLESGDALLLEDGDEILLEE